MHPTGQTRVLGDSPGSKKERRRDVRILRKFSSVISLWVMILLIVSRAEDVSGLHRIIIKAKNHQFLLCCFLSVAIANGKLQMRSEIFFFLVVGRY